jgi:hypothetical protein
VAYELNGKEVTTPPYDAQGYADAKPVYIEMPGWKTSTIISYSSKGCFSISVSSRSGPVDKISIGKFESSSILRM